MAGNARNTNKKHRNKNHRKGAMILEKKKLARDKRLLCFYFSLKPTPTPTNSELVELIKNGNRVKPQKTDKDYISAFAEYVRKKHPCAVDLIEDEKKPKAQPESFYSSKKWRTVRYEVLRENGKVCMCCGATKGEMHVDHIKPRSKFPKLELEKSNLQVLCKDCNFGKSNKFSDDWRKDS